MGISAVLKGIIKNTDSLYSRMEEITYEVIEPLIESGLSRAEAVAETVLGLLRIGEGRHVTNELLSSADKSYLVDNYDLPLDEISTLARARGQRIDLDKPMYRGRSDERGSPESLRSTKVYTTDNPMTAATYSDTVALEYMPPSPPLNDLNEQNLVKSNMIDKYVMRPSVDESGDALDPMIVNAQGKSWGNIPINSKVTIGEQETTLEDIFKELLRAKRLQKELIVKSWDKELPESMSQTSTDEISKILQDYGGELGFPKTVIYKNLVDTGAYRSRLDADARSWASEPSTVRMDLDKSTIRKAYNPEDNLEDRPRFDPRLRHLKNLLASAAPVAVSLGALSELKEEPQ